MSYYDKLRHRQMQAERVRSVVQTQILTELREKSKKRDDPFDRNIFNQGMEWYYTGFSIDDADEPIRDNTNFIRGFELASRQDNIRRQLEDLGAQWFYSGNSLENASSHDLKYEAFIKGYNEAKNNVKRRS